MGVTSMTLKELYKLLNMVQWEIAKRLWFVYVIIITSINGLIFFISTIKGIRKKR